MGRMVNGDASDGSGRVRVLFHRPVGQDTDDHARGNKRPFPPLASADQEIMHLERKTFTKPKDAAHDIERAQETVIKSLNAQHADWVDENG